jgi:hypothetical protein
MELGDHIIKTIKSGDVKMRSRWYFVLRDILGTVAIVIILLIAVYVCSFIIFVLHQDGAWFVPVFGFGGWFALFNALPWVLIVLSCLFVVALAFLVMRYPFSYRWPVLYSFLGICFLIAAASFLFVQTSFSNTFFSSPMSEDLPLFGEYYPGVGVLSPNNVHRGQIEVLTPAGFIVEGFFGTTSTVFIASQTDMMFAGPFEPGDIVVVFGNRSATGTIQAVGIEKIGNQ